MSLRTYAETHLYDLATLGANPWFRADMKADIANDPNRTRRILKLSAVATTQVAPITEVYKSFASRHYRKLGMEVIGIGYHSVALRESDHVQKILHRTADLDPDEKTSHLELLNYGQDRLADSLGDLVVRQEYTIEPFLLDPSRSCIVGRQQFIPGIAVDTTARSAQTAEFMADCDILLNEQGIVPDVVGRANILATDSGLRLIDTTPLSVENPRDEQALRHARTIIALHTSARSAIS